MFIPIDLIVLFPSVYINLLKIINLINIFLF